MRDEQDSSTLYRVELLLENEAASVNFAQDLALALVKGDLVALSGDLGAGKSTLARAIIRTIADDDFYEVPSPTFTLVQSYPELRLPIAHADLYRLSAAEELDELGLEEALESGAVLVEWPQQGEGVLPPPSISITLDHAESAQGDGRLLVMEVTAKAARRISRSLGIRTFLDKAGRKHAQRRYLLGDASPRGYELIRSDTAQEILMNAPAMPFDPVIKAGKAYRQIAHLAENIEAFAAMDQLLDENGFRVPKMLARDLDRGFLLIENLGTNGILDTEGQPNAERYAAAARLLAHLHVRDWPTDVQIRDLNTGEVKISEHKIEAPRSHHLHRFDRDAMLIEAELLPVWYAPYRLGYALDASERLAFETAWDVVFKQLETAEYSLLLRDYHSPNILWQIDATGTDRIGLIDFQDAMIGPAAYDLASLVMDARVTIPEPLQDQLIDAYCDERRKLGKVFDEANMRAALAIMAAQRNTKILGIFVRLAQRDGKPAYLQHLPRISGYLQRALQHPALTPLRDWYARNNLLGACSTEDE